MKIFAIVDFHGTTEILGSLLEKIKACAPDVVCFSGDVVKGHKRGDEWLNAKREGRAPSPSKEIEAEFIDDDGYLRKFYSELNRLEIPILTIPGNMDAPKSRYFKQMEYITETNKNIYLIHGKRHTVGVIDFIGYGGEINEPEEDYFVQISSPSSMRTTLESELATLKSKRFVLLTHHPPRGERVDTEDGITHRGSDFIADLIQIYMPVVAICGHIHKAKGLEHIGKTLVVNPGALKAGNAALIELNDEINVKFLTL
jgi:hypothetical protein